MDIQCFLEQLPTHTKGRYKGKIDFDKSIGEQVKFKYDDKIDYFTIIGKKSSHILKILYKNKEYELPIASLCSNKIHMLIRDNENTTVKTNTGNHQVTMIAYRGRKDIDVMFEDGTIRKNVVYDNFLKGMVLYPEEKARPTFKDISGQQFSHLLVKREASELRKDNMKDALWECYCDCGNPNPVYRTYKVLKQKKIHSCGCMDNEHRKLPNNEANKRRVLRSYKNNCAKSRGYRWGLTDEEFYNIIQKPCHYCGEVGSIEKYNKSTNEYFYHNGIDRVDNTKGYIHDNVVPCCTTCNIAKNDMNPDDFYKWIQRLSNHCKEKGFIK